MTGLRRSGIGRLLVWTLLPLLAVLMAGCGGDEVEAEPSLGQVERSEDVTAQNLVLVTDGQGVATLVGTLINDAGEADALVGVDVQTDGGSVPVVLDDAPIELPVNEQVRMAPPSRVNVVSDELTRGFRVDLELTFEKAAPISTTVTVEPRRGVYDSIEVPTKADLGQ